MSLRLVTRASSGWRRVFGIADQGLVALLVRVAAGVLARQNGSFLEAALVQNRHFWRLVRVRAPLGGAVSWGLLTRAWSRWLRVIGIGEQGVLWAAPCLWDC